MIEFGGKTYFIDFEKIDQLVTIQNQGKAQVIKDTEEIVIYDAKDVKQQTQITTSKYTKGKEVDGLKYETIRLMLEVILKSRQDDDEDSTLGIDRVLNKTSLSFKIAFNSLINAGVLKEMEE